MCVVESSPPVTCIWRSDTDSSPRLTQWTILMHLARNASFEPFQLDYHTAAKRQTFGTKQEGGKNGGGCNSPLELNWKTRLSVFDNGQWKY